MTCDWCGLEITGVQTTVHLSTEPPREYGRSVVAAFADGFSATLRALDRSRWVFEYSFHDDCVRELDSILRERRDLRVP